MHQDELSTSILSYISVGIWIETDKQIEKKCEKKIKEFNASVANWVENEKAKETKLLITYVFKKKLKIIASLSKLVNYESKN